MAVGWLTVAADATSSEDAAHAHDLRADVLFWSGRPADAEEALTDAEPAAETAAARQRIAVRRAIVALGTGDLAYAVAVGAIAEPSIAVQVRQDAVYVVCSAAPPCGRPAWAIDVVDEAQDVVSAAEGMHEPGCLHARARWRAAGHGGSTRSKHRSTPRMQPAPASC